MKIIIELLLSIVFAFMNCAPAKSITKTAKTTESKRIHNLGSNNYCSIQKILKEFSDVGNVGIVTMPDGSKREV